MYLAEANAALAQLLGDEAVVETAAEEGDLLAQELQNNEADAAAYAAYKKQNPLFALLQPSGARGGSGQAGLGAPDPHLCPHPFLAM